MDEPSLNLAHILSGVLFQPIWRIMNALGQSCEGTEAVEHCKAFGPSSDSKKHLQPPSIESLKHFSVFTNPFPFQIAQWVPQPHRARFLEDNLPLGSLLPCPCPWAAARNFLSKMPLVSWTISVEILLKLSITRSSWQSPVTLLALLAVRTFPKQSHYFPVSTTTWGDGKSLCTWFPYEKWGLIRLCKIRAALCKDQVSKRTWNKNRCAWNTHTLAVMTSGKTENC